MARSETASTPAAGPRRRLGAAGPDLFGIGLGCMTMSATYGPSDDAESIATIRRALELGVELLDTADVYGDGHGEQLLARALAGRRDEAFVATKIGNVTRPDGSRGVDGSPDYVARACEASLKRLQSDRIDLLYLHRVDPDTPIEDTVGAMARLVEDGKVRFIGLSEAGAATIRRAQAVHPLAAVQSEYSLWTRDCEAEVLPTCRQLGIAFVAYSPLSRGLLSGAMDGSGPLPQSDRRSGFPRFQGEALAHNRRAARLLDEMAAERACTAAQLAIAWLLSRGDDVLPIPGCKRRTHLEENVAAGALYLSPDDRERLSRALDPGAVQGERFPPAQMARINL